MTKIHELMTKSTKTVLLTGNGIIESGGLPDGSKYPMKSHMAIVQLIRKDIISHVITSNTDGLQTMSVIPSERLTELNGNTNTACCNKCGQVYFRDFNVRNFTKDLEVLNTGRKCDKGDKCLEG